MEDKIQSDLKEAMKAGDKTAVGTYRMLLSALKNRRIEKKGDLDEGEVLEILRREVKSRKEAAEAFRKGDRAELADKEEAEIQVLQRYLPEEISEDELRALVREQIEEAGATEPKHLGKVMGPLMGRLKGRVDGTRVRQAVQEALGGGGGPEEG